MVNFISKFNDNEAFLEILGDDNNIYHVDFIDIDNNKILYSSDIGVNHWSKVPVDKNINVSIKVYLNNSIVFEKSKKDKFNKVYIKFGSGALGDSIAWIPYVEEYRKINNVNVILNTNFKFLFDEAYPDIEFTDITDPDAINGVDKKFRIDYGPELYIRNGKIDSDFWYEENKLYDNYVDYFDYRKISLQSVASLILGLPEVEIVPKVNIPKDNGNRIKGKYVVVAIQSTSQMKYWNNVVGWSKLFDFFKKIGYKVVIIDKYRSFGVEGFFNEAPKGKNVIFKTGDIPLSDRITDIKYADMMITISSGLAWLSWAVGTPVVMISGFTKPWNEFKSNIVRIHNNEVCNGCWNDENITFNAFNWMYCPKNKMFECSRRITPKKVIEGVKKFIK